MSTATASADSRPDAEPSPHPAERLAALRARLAAGLLPEPGRLRGSAALRAATVVVGWCVAFAAAWFRIGPGDRDVLWAEDARVFLTQQLDLGFASALAEPYNGYRHLVPRLSAGLAAQLPLQHAAFVLTACATAVVATSAVAVAVLARGHVAALWPRLLLGALVVLLPVGGLEAVGNVANSHWYLMAAAFWALVARGGTWPRTVLATVVVVLAMGSDPLTLMLFPLAAARLLLLGRSREQLPTVAFVLVAALQLPVLSTAARGERLPGTTRLLPDAFAARVPLELLTGWGRGPALVADLGGAATLLGIGACVVLLSLSLAAPVRFRWLGVAAVLASAAYFVVPAAVTGGAVLSVGGATGFDAVAASRYSIVPQLLLSAALLGAVAGLARLAGRRVAQVLGGLLVVGLALVSLSDYAAPSRNAPASWTQEVDQARDGCTTGATTVDVPVTPAGWAAVVPCEVLTEDQAGSDD